MLANNLYIIVFSLQKRVTSRKCTYATYLRYKL